MKLTYWVANCLNDHWCYSIRKKTKKEVVAEIAAYYKPENYSQPKKVTIEYDDAFDLMAQCIDGESYGGYWERSGEQ
jgi:hypothetical protein